MFDLDFPFPELREKKITIFLVLLLPPLLLCVCELVSPLQERRFHVSTKLFGVLWYERER